METWMRLILFPKMVRDNIPARIEENDGFCIIKYLAPIEHREALLTKLVEEAKEVRKAKTHEERQEEIADVLEVLLTLQSAFCYSSLDLEAIRKRKFILAGGFRKGIKLMFAFGGR
jgi:predicted house-cleaning noncanonical NTP pyrophosphatase (MazG superfamily)